jgi:predicted DNA-binding transcriptional regulator YafY
MNRIDRLFAITTLLQSKGRVRAEDLAAAFEVSTRTIYRDIAALSEAGIPVVSLPGQGYALTDGFFLPPLLFTAAEASAMTLGARIYASQVIGRGVADAERAVEKVAAILPADVRRQVERLMEIVQIVLPPRRLDIDDPRLTLLQQAMLERRVAFLRYHGRASGTVTEREVEPRTLAYYDGAWYLAGYCRLRGGERSFHLDRIDDLTLRDERFAPREVTWSPATPITVRVRFETETARWVRERQHWSFQGEEPSTDGVVMTYQPDDPREIANWILGWGRSAEALSPPELRKMVRAEALAVAARLDDATSH